MSECTTTVTWKELSEDDKFGENSHSDVKEIDGTYAIVRECDSKELLRGDSLKKYLGDIITIMHTGIEYGSGDFVLYSDRHGIIHAWMYERDTEEDDKKA